MTASSAPIGRREALGLIGGVLIAAPAGAAATNDALRFAGLDHVEFTVSNIEASTAFYSRIFGNTVLKNNRTSRRYIKLGPCFIAGDVGRQIAVDHFCAGIEGYDIAALHKYLDQRGIAYKDFPSGKDLAVADPDGIRMQLGAANSWEQLLQGTASPEAQPAGAEPIFRPVGLDHILLHVSNPERSAEFYARIFGPVSQRNNNRTWFQVGKSRVGLLQIPPGQKPGVNHYCVGVEAFDYDAATKNLKEAGAKLETPEVSGAPEFRDADGYLVQAMAASA